MKVWKQLTMLSFSLGNILCMEGDQWVANKQMITYPWRSSFLLDFCPLGCTKHIDKMRQVQKYFLRALQGSNIKKGCFAVAVNHQNSELTNIISLCILSLLKLSPR